MFRTPPYALPALVLLSFVVIGCSSQLPSMDTSPDYVLELRAEYLAAHPDGEFNEYVQRGEVVKGMDYLAVLASWGHPTRRARISNVSEDWIYHEVDEDTDSWMEFKFVFHNNILDDWEIARFNGGAKDLAPSWEGVLTRSTRPGGKRVPTN